MPRWLSRLLWAVRGKRRARLHLAGDAPSPEGILVGRWGGHYVLLSPTLHVSESETYAIDGTLEVPAERVFFVQVLP